MKRLLAAAALFCMLFSACGGSDSDELIVEVQRDVTVPIVTELPTAAPTLDTTEFTEPPAEEHTEPTIKEPTEPPTEEPTEESSIPETEALLSEGQDYVLNKSSKKFHYPHCGSVKQMKEQNRKDFYAPREEVLSMGYVPCKNCKP